MSRTVHSWLSLFLAGFLAGLVVGGCSSQETPAGGSGAGGSSSVGSGAGGETPIAPSDAGSCIQGDTVACVSSCSVAPFTRAPNSCVNGLAFCPAGYVLLSSCAYDSCAQVYRSCCDDTTGSTMASTCDSSGQLTCPTGSHVASPDCIPASLGGVSDCSTLDYQSCNQQGQRCTSNYLYCSCSLRGPADSGLSLSWSCMPLIP